jgi:quercetin dioxygenase-like cupin family protein
MKTRRGFLGLVTALVLSYFRGLRAKAQTPARAPAKELARYPLTGAQEGMEAILVEVTALPGAPSTAHRHPGFVLGYVLEGEMQFGINGGSQQIVKTGGTFFEPIGSLHSTGGSAKPDAAVRFLAFIVAPKGSPLTLPA